MKGIVLVSPFWTAILSAGKADAVTVFPFVLVRRKADRTNGVLMNHESIHLRQAAELLILPFYIWYGTEFLIRYVRYRDWHAAYLNLSFEREAYRNEEDLTYLRTRRFWGFIPYFKPI